VLSAAPKEIKRAVVNRAVVNKAGATRGAASQTAVSKAAASRATVNKTGVTKEIMAVIKAAAEEFFRVEVTPVVDLYRRVDHRLEEEDLFPTKEPVFLPWEVIHFKMDFVLHR